jgi:glycine/D-amino acid oxidase-like deaminating enzyme
VPERWEAIVVGAGICGLAAAFALSRRGRRVLVLEASGVGAGQSAGDARIFRIAHTDPELCALALEARERWREWEAALGARLLGDEGLVVTPGEAHAAAMRAAGAPVEAIGRAEIRARVPLLREDHPYDAAVWDPLAGTTRVRTTLDALAARLDVRRATVEAVGADGTVVADGETLTGDAVVVCAGVRTPGLVAPLGLDLALTIEPHVRVAYEAGGRSACLISPECYALPEGRTFAVGMHTPGDPPDMFVPLVKAGEIECVSLYAPWLDERGDGFTALRAGRVIALGASNAMKFGPLLGDRLARSALEPAGVHADLRRCAATR